MIREFVYSDEIFYWARTGSQPTVLEARCTLAQDVEPQALREALLGALRAHTNFRARPLVVRNRLLASIEDVKNPPLYEYTGIGRRLGTEETEQLMLYVTHRKRLITLRPENLYERVRSTWRRPVPFIYIPLPAQIKSKAVVRVGRMLDAANHTYGISYAGKETSNTCSQSRAVARRQATPEGVYLVLHNDIISSYGETLIISICHCLQQPIKYKHRKS